MRHSIRNTLMAGALAVVLSGCSLPGGMVSSVMDTIFGRDTVEDIQQSRTAREVHVVVAGMFEVIVKELKLMLRDGTITVVQGQMIQPMIKIGRTAIVASNAFLLQASQQRELGRDGMADLLETKAFDQLRTANANLDILRSAHLAAIETAPLPFVAEPPPLLQTPAKTTEG